jgi:hypothetical protein
MIILIAVTLYLFLVHEDQSRQDDIYITIIK